MRLVLGGLVLVALGTVIWSLVSIFKRAGAGRGSAS